MVKRDEFAFSDENDEFDDDLFDLLDEQLTRSFGPSLANRPTTAATPVDPVRENRMRLERFTVARLRELAERYAIPISGNRKEPILQAVAEGMARSETIAIAVNRLSSSIRLALDLAVILDSTGAALDRSTFSKILTAAYQKKSIKATSESSLAELGEAGLAVLLPMSVKIPASIVTYLPPDPQLVLPYTGQLPVIRSTEPFELARLAVHILLLAQAGLVEVRPQPKDGPGNWPVDPTESKAGQKTWSSFGRHTVHRQPLYLSDKSLQKLSEETGQPAGKLDYLARLLGEAGLWSVAKRQVLSMNPTHLASFLSISPAEQMQRLYRVGLNLSSWTEFDLASAKHGLTEVRETSWGVSYPMYLQTKALARKTLFETLRLVPANKWIDVEDLLILQHAMDVPNNHLASNNPIWINHTGKRSEGRNYAEWRPTYGHLYSAILGGPAQWLGIVDTAWDNKQLVAARSTHLAEYYFGRVPDIEVATAQEAKPALFFSFGLEVELNPALASAEILSLLPLLGQIEAPSPLEPAKLASVWKKPKSKGLLRYQLTPDGAARVFELGWTPEKILATFSAAADPAGRTPPPEQIDQRIHAWWERYGRLHIYADLALIEFTDDACLNELLAGTNLNRHLLYVFNPRLVAIRPEGVQEVLESLEANGYTPRLKAGAGDQNG